ncbi:hypothetical protein K4A83_17985 [Spirulina subsalsa FACHB-351]|uniref:Uncharacterized protein n=1 Tax=Spirulina subsalsa FACHB-351 TaxID=234711 RepID=A0ABT3L9F0_9CYAN|nr:hypothetical protein [Spirulina subsalsa]MCW6038146.1 hypothetical protein [Spirulina subsalsa FACHB-351]
MKSTQAQDYSSSISHSHYNKAHSGFFNSSKSARYSPTKSSAAKEPFANQMDVESCEANIEQVAQRSQGIILDYFTQQAKSLPSERIIEEFMNLFIDDIPFNKTLEQAFYDLIVINLQEQFRQVLVQCYYTLIKEFLRRNEYEKIPTLVEKLAQSSLQNRSLSMVKRRLHEWRKCFLASPDYQKLLFLANWYTRRYEDTWSRRYAYYIFLDQSLNSGSSELERECARILARRIQKKYKFKLAIYLAHLDVPNAGRSSYNPTKLNRNSLHLIQKVLVKQKSFNYQSLANIFLKQTQGLSFKEFKNSLLKYLGVALGDEQVSGWVIKAKLAKQIEPLYTHHDDVPWDAGLLLRTCKRVLSYLLNPPDDPEANHPFNVLTRRNHYLTLTILVLKILLICPNSYQHMITYVSALIQRYQGESVEKCQWLINFLETLTVVLTIASAQNADALEGHSGLPCSEDRMANDLVAVA